MQINPIKDCSFHPGRYVLERKGVVNNRQVVKITRTLEWREFIGRLFRDLWNLFTQGSFRREGYFTRKEVIEFIIDSQPSLILPWHKKANLAFIDILQPPSLVNPNLEKSYSHISDSKIEEAYKNLKTETDEFFLKLMPESFQECTKKIHRFNNLNFPKETCVKVAGMTDDNYLSVNLVHVDEHYSMLTQYPYYDDGRYWFWKISKEKGSLVVDLTNSEDLKKPWMLPYFPTGFEETQSNNGIDVKFIQIVGLKEVQGGCLYLYEVTEEDTPQYVPRLHFSSWPDHGTPEIDHLIQILKYIRFYQADGERCPLIHCRAGVGRTGTVAALLVMADLILARRVNPENLLEQINQAVLKIRQQREKSCVQNPAQYALIVRVCEKILACPSIILPTIQEVLEDPVFSQHLNTSATLQACAMQPRGV